MLKGSILDQPANLTARITGQGVQIRKEILMDELTNKPLSLLNELDVAWLQALNCMVERQVANA